MTRPLRRPGYPWPGQFGLGPQSVDEIVRRLNERPSGPPPRQYLGIRWVRPLTGAEFQTLKDTSVAGPSEENYQDILQAQRLSDDEVIAYSPSMWVRWVDSDTESDDQTAYSIDYNDEAFKVYFPMFAWARDNNAAAQTNHMKLLRRHLMSKGEKGRFPVAFNPRTGNWECISLTEAMPTHIWAKPTAEIKAATAAGSVTTFGSGEARFWVNKQITPTVQNEDMGGPDNTITVYNWTDEPLEKDKAYEFWLDVQSAKYMVSCCGKGNKIGHVMICETQEANEETCLYDAVLIEHKIDELNGSCRETRKHINILARCISGYTGELVEGYCVIGYSQGETFKQPGEDEEEKEVWYIECGNCPVCACPDSCKPINVTIEAPGCITDPIKEEMFCIDYNPMVPLVVLGSKWWYKEFTVPGKEVRLVWEASGIYEHGDGLTYEDSLYVEFDCGFSASGSIAGVYDINLQPLTSYTLTGGYGDKCCPLTAESTGDALLYKARTYHYVVVAKCHAGTGIISEAHIYWVKHPSLRNISDSDAGVQDCSSQCDDQPSRTFLNYNAVWADRTLGEAGPCCLNSVMKEGLVFFSDCDQKFTEEGILISGLPPFNICPECIHQGHIFAGCPCAEVYCTGDRGPLSPTNGCDFWTVGCDDLRITALFEWEIDN